MTVNRRHSPPQSRSPGSPAGGVAVVRHHTRPSADRGGYLTQQDGPDTLASVLSSSGIMLFLTGVTFMSKKSRLPTDPPSVKLRRRRDTDARKPGVGASLRRQPPMLLWLHGGLQHASQTPNAVVPGLPTGL